MILVERARIVDGSGAPPFIADVAVNGARIEAIGDLSSLEAAVRVDARGLVLAPGFIDVHTHSDLTVLADPRAVSQLSQGVTCQVTGQCGFSAAPRSSSTRLSEQVLGPVPHFEIEWSDFASYRERLETNRPNTHVVPMVGHGALRRRVLHDPSKPASFEEIDRLQRELEICFDQGARGLSFGLEYAPGRFASTEELVALSKVAARHGVPVSVHVRNRDVRFREGLLEVMDLAEKSGAQFHVSHIAPKHGAAEGAMEWMLSQIDRRRDGAPPIRFDEVPYLWGATRMSAALPPELSADDVDGMRRELKRPGAAGRLRDFRESMWQLVPEGRADLLRLARAPGSEELEGESLDAVTERLGLNLWEAMVRILLAAGERAHEVTWLGRFKKKEDLDELLRRDDCLFCSDGVSLAPDGPLAGVQWSRACYGWAARTLDLLVGRRGLPVEKAIHRLTGAAAEALGFRRRGRLTPGAPADMVLIDFDRLQERATYEDPAQLTEGIKKVWVSGRPALSEGTIAHTSSGEVL